MTAIWIALVLIVVGSLFMAVAFYNRHMYQSGKVSGVVLVIVGLIILLLSQPALSHDFWISHGKYKSPRGEHCCGDNDCFLVPAGSVSYTEDGWLIESTGEVVPLSETQRSEDNEFWRCKRYDGSRRCFFAPEPTS